MLRRRGDLGDFAEVLGGGGEEKFVICAAWAALADWLPMTPAQGLVRSRYYLLTIDARLVEDSKDRLLFIRRSFHRGG